MEARQQWFSVSDLPRLLLQHKNSLSVETDAPSLTGHRTKTPIVASSTSLNLLESVEFMQEKKIFSQYLFENNPREQEKVMIVMTDFYKKIPEDHKEKVMCLLPKREGNLQDSVLNYFVSVWLKDMGYGSSQNKKYLQRMARLYLG